MYTVQKLAQLAGVSGRTLRYYDEIELLKPARINSSGYRIYGQKEVDRLQQILFYRELDMDLDTIKSILSSSSFDELIYLVAFSRYEYLYLKISFLQFLPHVVDQFFLSFLIH